MSEQGDISDESSEFQEDDHGDIDDDPEDGNTSVSSDSETDEIKKEVKVTKNKIDPTVQVVIKTIVKPENRRGRNLITTGELSALIAYRVASLQNGDPHFLKQGTIVPHNPIDIAMLELEQRRSPFLIMREMGKTIELWNPNHMDHPRNDS